MTARARGSRADIETPLMQRTFDAAIFHIAVAQEREPMRANVVRGIHFSIEQIKRDALSPMITPSGSSSTRSANFAASSGAIRRWLKLISMLMK